MTVLWGRCFEGEDASAYAPWVEALGGYLRELDGNRLQRHLGQHAAALAQILPNVRDALHDLPAPPSTTPGENRMRLFDAVVHAVLVAADERPVLLVLDDLHWADQASLALLRHLARHIADAAVLVLCTLREEELAANEPLDELITMLRREAPYQHITLPDLSFDESSALAALVLEQRQQNERRGNAMKVGLGKWRIPRWAHGVVDSICGSIRPTGGREASKEVLYDDGWTRVYAPGPATDWFAEIEYLRIPWVEAAKAKSAAVERPEASTRALQAPNSDHVRVVPPTNQATTFPTPKRQRLTRWQQLTLNTWRHAAAKVDRVLDPRALPANAALHTVLATLRDVDDPMALFGRYRAEFEASLS